MRMIVRRHGAMAGVEVFKRGGRQAVVDAGCPLSLPLSHGFPSALGTVSQVFVPSAWFPE